MPIMGVNPSAVRGTNGWGATEKMKDADHRRCLPSMRTHVRPRTLYQSVGCSRVIWW